jgi:hypothetical protein
MVVGIASAGSGQGAGDLPVTAGQVGTAPLPSPPGRPRRSAGCASTLTHAERILAAVPLVKRGEWDRYVQVALVLATLAVAAGVLGEWQTVADRENHEEPPEPDGR